VTPSISISRTPSISVTPSVTPSTSLPLYTYLRFDVDTANCTTSNPQPFYSLNNYGAGYYYINGNFSVYYYISSNPHTNYTNQITSVSATSCTPISPTPSTTPSVSVTPSISISETPSVTPSPAPSFYYNNAYRNTCNGASPCTDDGIEVVLRSSTPLSNGSWYSDGSKSYQPYGSTSGPIFDVDIDPYIYTQAANCEDACNNY
jgi:hypothetical protein